MSDEEKTPEAPTQEEVDALAEEAEPEDDKPCDEGPTEAAETEEKAPE